MSDLIVRPVTGKADLERFIGVTRYIYRDDPNWIQPLDVLLKDTLSPSKNPYFDHAEVVLYIAERHGWPVGRISAQIDALAQEKWGPDLGQFGFFEAEDEEVAHLLLGAAEACLRERGSKRMQGPWSFSAKDEGGVLVEGFNTPPAFLMPHGKPAYDSWIKSYGLKKAEDLFAYELDLARPFAAKAQRIVQAAQRNPKITQRQANMKNFSREVATILDIVEDAWSENWCFTPYTEREAEHLSKTLKLVLKPYKTLICDYEGEPAAFMITLPDLNHDIRDFNGKLFPFNIFKLLGRRVFTRKEGRQRVPLMGVRKTFQSRVSGAAMAFWLIEQSRINVAERGSAWGELSYILESNTGMNKILLDIGCVLYKTYRVYEKPID